MNDTCSHCEIELPDDDEERGRSLWAILTPPGSQVASIMEFCSDSCINAMLATGWHQSTQSEQDLLDYQVRKYGYRVGP